MTETPRFGTNHFKSLAHAVAYYRPYGEDRASVEAKLSDGAIAIGPPADLGPGEAFEWDPDGRGVRYGGVKAEPVDTDTLKILAAARTEGDALFLPGQLDRKVYQKVAAVIEAVGGKWNRKRRAHVFATDAADAIETVILTGRVIREKQEFGQFYTPAALAARVVVEADIGRLMKVLEPSAGQGALVRAVMQAEPTADILAVEINRKNVQAMNCIVSDIWETNFLSIQPPNEGIFDRVVMNPPFAKRADIRHVMHALRFLKPGGRLVSIMSAGVAFRSDALTVEFRTMVERNGGSIEPLPDRSFAESGTNVQTVLVVINKPAE